MENEELIKLLIKSYVSFIQCEGVDYLSDDESLKLSELAKNLSYINEEQREVFNDLFNSLKGK